MTRQQNLSGTFAIPRPDGRSNQQVVIELVRDAAPGTVFGYRQLAEALRPGAGHAFDRKAVQEAVRAANPRLLREHRRELACVPKVGYKLAHASEHVTLSGARTRRGHRQFRRATQTLEYARLDEMTEPQRAVHLAQQAINAELYAVQSRLLRKQAQQGRLIASLTSRVEQMEGRLG